jgi:hypothetical protein
MLRPRRWKARTAHCDPPFTDLAWAPHVRGGGDATFVSRATTRRSPFPYGRVHGAPRRNRITPHAPPSAVHV